MKSIIFSEASKIKSLIFIVSLLILCGCSQVNNKPINKFGDGGFLSREPCGPPCFYGIVPGITTQDEVIGITKKSDDIFNRCVYVDLSSSGGTSGIICDYFDLLFSNNKVNGLDYYPSITITSPQIIDFYGDPDSISVFVSSLIPEESVRVKMAFCYDRLRATIVFSEQDGTEYKIDENTIVQYIIYDTQETYNLSCGSDKEKKSWLGYGNYEGFLP